MKAKALYQAGKLNEAIQALNAEIRENPTDAQRRVFLFELLCFAGDYDRATQEIRRALELDPKNPRMQARLNELMDRKHSGD